VNYVAASKSFVCPCHGGVYDFQGKVIGGPPVRPLDRFQTRVEKGQVQIGPRYSVTSQLQPVRARDPGEFTGGVWDYIYPPRPDTAPAP
jgi:menaquinol-cytochrome c reductase iron-sulfur subunit